MATVGVWKDIRGLMFCGGSICLGLSPTSTSWWMPWNWLSCRAAEKQKRGPTKVPVATDRFCTLQAQLLSVRHGLQRLSSCGDLSRDRVQSPYCRTGTEQNYCTTEIKRKGTFPPTPRWKMWGRLHCGPVIDAWCPAAQVYVIMTSVALWV